MRTFDESDTSQYGRNPNTSRRRPVPATVTAPSAIGAHDDDVASTTSDGSRVGESTSESFAVVAHTEPWSLPAMS